MPRRAWEPLLIPPCLLYRKLRVLIDSRFDLQRAIDQLRFREIVDDRRTVWCTVAAPGNPTNQIYEPSSGWPEWFALRCYTSLVSVPIA